MICMRPFLFLRVVVQTKVYLNIPLHNKGYEIICINKISGKSMLENKKLSDRERRYQFLRRIPISNRTIAYDIVNRDSNEKRVSKVVDNNVM